MRQRDIQTLFIILGILIVTAVSSWSVAPTQEVIEKWQAEGVLEQKIANWNAFKARGGCSPVEHAVINKQKLSKLALDGAAVDTVRVIVILIDFSDNPYTGGVAAGTPEQFDSILFSDSRTDTIINPTGSMTDYYLENSYGKFYIQGDIYGWYRAPKTYAYYVGTDNGLSHGAELTADAAALAHADSVDFSLYDNDNDGECDGLIIIHAGLGAEGSGDGIWSHKGSLSGVAYDGVVLKNYTMNPEETAPSSLSPIGVFCHEYGHFLGLPDLYDIDYFPPTSDGLGRWSLMASGNYNGSGKKPAHLDAWCKAQVGFLSFIQVDSNIFHAEIPAVEYNPVAYRLRNSTTGEQEFWVVENRQKTGFDIQLPGSGLLIYHVDLNAAPNNVDFNRYYVALEQADGNNDLALTTGNRGDAGDPFPGNTNNREFHNLSNPDSKTNFGTVTKIGVWNITDSDSLMYADLDIEYSRPWVELVSTQFLDDPPGGDGDGILEPGETIQFFCTIRNKMRYSYNIYATLESDNPDVIWVSQTVPFNNPNVDLLGTNRSNVIPVEFTLADSVIPVIDSFTLIITTDSLSFTPGSGEFQFRFGIEKEVGAPQVLVVDDDGGSEFEKYYDSAFTRLRVPHRLWNVDSAGAPAVNDLMNYAMVFWLSGDASPGIIDTTDIATMKSYMDNGRSLFYSSRYGVNDIFTLDSMFMKDYFHARIGGLAEGNSNSNFSFLGVTGTVYEGTNYIFRNTYGLPDTYTLEATSGGQVGIVSEYLSAGKPYAVTYAGSHRSILLSFPAGYISNISGGYNPIDTILYRSLQYFGGIATSVYDGQAFAPLPKTFELNQNYPNPFNPVTVISYTLHGTGGLGEIPPRTVLSVYNVLGQKVITLVDEVQPPGTYSVEWDGTSSSGRAVASGIYLYRLERGSEQDVKKMILLK